MNSSRLPNKVMMPLASLPNLYHVYSRVSQCEELDKVIIATSKNRADQRIVDFCNDNNIECFCGREQDVLDRYYMASKKYGAKKGDIIVRITADCPLIDPERITEVLDLLNKTNADYVSNNKPPTFPDGYDVEAFTFTTLESTWSEAILSSDREHVTSYIKKNHNKYRIENYINTEDLSRYRLTLDEEEDYILLNKIFEALYTNNKKFRLEDVINFLDKNKELLELNSKFSRNEGYIKSLEKDNYYETAKDTVLNGKTILITGGTGSFGKKFIDIAFEKYNPKKIIIYSRDEFKQNLLRKKLHEKNLDSKVEFFIGDVRDKERLYKAFNGVDYVIHAAALKQVPSCEYNPSEAVKTNINGAQNVIDASLYRDVKKVVALSTDKAVNPINLYGGTKLISDKLFISANAYSKGNGPVFSLVRYGNVAGSRGSVIPFFKSIIEENNNELPITDFRMTRFWITLEQGVELVLRALAESKGGETYIAKIPSFSIIDLAKAMKNDSKLIEVGIREGEKLHEVMITKDDSRMTYEYENHYIVYPNVEWWDFERYFKPGGRPLEEGFEYSSNNNKEWLDVEQLRWALRINHLI